MLVMFNFVSTLPKTEFNKTLAFIVEFVISVTPERLKFSNFLKVVGTFSPNNFGKTETRSEYVDEIF